MPWPPFRLIAVQWSPSIPEIGDAFLPMLPSRSRRPVLGLHLLRYMKLLGTALHEKHKLRQKEGSGSTYCGCVIERAEVRGYLEH